MLDKLSRKKRSQINKSLQKANIRETSPKKATISSLNNLDKNELLFHIASIKTSKPKVKDIDIGIIGADAYYATCC